MCCHACFWYKEEIDMAMGNFDREELNELLESIQFRKLRETMEEMK